MTVDPSIDRAAATSAKIHFENGDLALAIATYKTLLSCKRASVRERAARFILQHEASLKKAENPGGANTTNNTTNISITVSRMKSKEGQDE